MPISRSLMERQLRMGGGIMEVAPRQGALLGGLKKAVKGVAKGIGSFLKSDLGKAALLGVGAFGLPGTNFKGFLGGSGGFKLPEFLSGLSGEKTLGKTLKVGAMGSLLGMVLGGLDEQEEEDIVEGRNISALETKLRTAYDNLGTFKDDPEGLEAQIKSDLSEYNKDMSRGLMSNGGRINYARGTDQIVDQASGIMGLPQRVNQAGVKELDLRESGGFIPPVGIKEKADDIPAMLSNNEFVFTADAVRGMGGGDVNRGAQRLYDQMKMLEKGGRV